MLTDLKLLAVFIVSPSNSSISTATPGTVSENFETVAAVIGTLPAKSDMVNHDPRIRDDRESERVVEEERNVRLSAFLYAASRENDNDFHLIVGLRFNASRTVERAMPSRRAISCVETDENFSRIISRAWRIVIRSAGTDCSLGIAKGAT